MHHQILLQQFTLSTENLGINHTPSHSHPGTYSKATPQFSGPEPFEPGQTSNWWSSTGSCQSLGYTECQFSDPTVPQTHGRMVLIRSLTMVMKHTNIHYQQQIDSMISLMVDSTWDQVPAQSWPPPGPHPSGLQAASDLSYTFFGSQYTEPFTVLLLLKLMHNQHGRVYFLDQWRQVTEEIISVIQVDTIQIQYHHSKCLMLLFRQILPTLHLPAGTDLGTNQELLFLSCGYILLVLPIQHCWITKIKR